MNHSQGWVKLHRQILEWEWYDDHNVFRLFTYLLLKANHKDRKYKGTLVKVGQLLTGREKLANETGLTVMQVRTALGKLKESNVITITSSKKGTVIQIVNYHLFQQQPTEQPKDNQIITTNKNVKKKPTVEEFVEYALMVRPTVSVADVRRKYFEWVDNDWVIKFKDGDREIKNWKNTLRNTLEYLKSSDLNNNVQIAKPLNHYYE